MSSSPSEAGLMWSAAAAAAPAGRPRSPLMCGVIDRAGGATVPAASPDRVLASQDAFQLCQTSLSSSLVRYLLRR